jgi:hypothetical protein
MFRVTQDFSAFILPTTPKAISRATNMAIYKATFEVTTQTWALVEHTTTQEVTYDDDEKTPSEVADMATSQGIADFYDSEAKCVAAERDNLELACIRLLDDTSVS